MKRFFLIPFILLLSLCSGYIKADLVHNFSDQRFDGTRYEVLGSQPSALKEFTVTVRLEGFIVKNGTYAWALRCDDRQGKMQWAFYRAGWNNNFGFYLNCTPKPVFVHMPSGMIANGLHSLAAVVTPQEIKLYCDNKLIKTEPLAARNYQFATRDGVIFAGAADKNKQHGFHGNIEQIQFLERALSAKQLEYSFGTPRRPAIRVLGIPAVKLPERSNHDFPPESRRDELTTMQVVDWRFAPESSYQEIAHSVKMLKESGFDTLFVGGSFRYLFAEKYGDRNWWAAMPWTTYKQTVGLLNKACTENNLPLVMHLTCNLALLPDIEREFADMTMRELSDPDKTVEWKNYFGLPLCPNNPDFAEKYLARLQELYAAAPGLDGLMIDEIAYGPGYTACGCKYCREKFLAAYADKMPDPTDKSVWHKFSSKLFRQWVIFRCDSVRQNLQRLENLVKSQGGKQFFTNCNYNPSEAHFALLHGVNPLRTGGELLFYECEPCHPWDYRRAIAEGKYFQSQQRELLLHGYASSVSQAYYQQLLASVMNWGYQQWTEFNNFSFHPVNWFSFWKPLNYGRKSVAKIALVIAPEDNTVSDYNNKNGNVVKEYYGWAQALTEAHIPFEVIQTGHIKEAGKSFETLILPNTMAWRDEHIADLQNFLRHGGKIIATGKSFSLTEAGDTRPAVKFQGNIQIINKFIGEKYAVSRIGGGWYGNGATWFDDRDPAAKREMLNLIPASSKSVLKTGLPQDVIVNIYQQEYKNYRGKVIKLLNLTGTRTQGGVAVPGNQNYEFINYPTIEKDCSITIQSAEKITDVYMISPDFNEIVTCNFTTSGKNTYTINFPLLARYSIIYCAIQNDLVKALAPQAEFTGSKPEILPFDFRYISVR
ncbi:MAG: hypothetical protein E7056_08775 [Lentisphaerae bacterium]|nr:hypothetical protein [Lentisphaerota bacterium]